MKEIEFNLLEEPWIRVRTPNCTLKEVSLTDALLHAHEYADLAGELPTQDVAVLRLLLAVLQTIFYRVDVEGNQAPLTDEEEALERWGQLWEKKRLPEKPILDYLATWKDRFWLFHPERPFYQVATLKNGIEFGAQKLNGEISQSENKVRLFSSYTGLEKEHLSYPQVARWLLYINGYDEQGGRPKPGNLPRKGVGWLGQIGYIAIRGSSFFEILLRNLVFLKDGEELYGPPTPCWENEKVREEQSCPLVGIDNQAQLLTMQSRRILLEREEQGPFVKGYSLLGGDYIDTTQFAPFIEQATLWGKTKESKNKPIYYYPKIHDSSKQLWREFPVFFEDRVPGVLKWSQVLAREGILPRRASLNLLAVANMYDPSQKSTVIDSYTDTLSFHMEVLDSLGISRSKVIQEIQSCEKIANCVGGLAKEISKAAGNESDGWVKAAKERFYFSIDQPFRRWLADLDPEEDIDEAVLSWRSQAKHIARQVGQKLVEEAGPSALVGRHETIKKGNNEIKVYHAAPKAFNRFLGELKKIYGEKGGSKP